MRQVRGAGRKTAAKRSTKRATKRATKSAPKKAAKRTTKAPSKKRASPAKRGRSVSFAKVWERRIEGWRRFLARNAWVRTYAVLATLTIAVYGVWASGVLPQAGAAISNQTHASLVAAGFTVNRITMSGHEETSPSDIMDAVAVEIGTPIFDVDLAELKARVEELDWVESASVVRALPDTIHVDITEREPFALWQMDGALQVVSADGTVIHSAAVERFSHLPQVVGRGAAEEAQALFAVIDTVPTIATRVRYAVRVSDRRWDLQFDNDMVVQLPELHMAEALTELVRYDEENRLFARAIATVDLRLEDRIVVRPSNSVADDRPQLAPTGRDRET